jgi:small redox-active disulfide protein 2
VQIVIYGPGCARCHETHRVVRHVVEQLGVAATLEKVSDYQAMAAAGVMATPAVSIDGVLKSAGRIPKSDEVREWLTASEDRHLTAQG